MEPLASRQSASKDGRLRCQSYIQEDAMCGEYGRCLPVVGGTTMWKGVDGIKKFTNVCDSSAKKEHFPVLQ